MANRIRNSIGYFLSWASICGCVLTIQPVKSQPSPPAAMIQATDPQPKPPKLTKVVFFGSSTTVGFGTTRGDRRWSTLLSRYFNWQEINEGLSGSTVSRVQRNHRPEPVTSGVERWRSNVLSRHPDRVIVMYGVNDAFLGIPLGSAGERSTYHGDLTQMLTGMAQELTPKRLIIISSQPNQATLDRREPYDRILQETTKQIGGYFIDAGREAFPVSDLQDYSADGLHLNNFGHAIFASYLANKMVDLGLEPAPHQASGGNYLPGSQPEPLPGGFLHIDLRHPLSFGRIRTIEATWVAPGRARIAIMRPDGRGGYEAIYRSAIFDVSPGISKIEVSNWWVLDDDRLAVWTEGNGVGGYSLAPNAMGHLAVPQGNIIRDINAARGRILPQALAIHAIP